jgi:hypothetical protein
MSTLDGYAAVPPGTYTPTASSGRTRVPRRVPLRRRHFPRVGREIDAVEIPLQPAHGLVPGLAHRGEDRGDTLPGAGVGDGARRGKPLVERLERWNLRAREGHGRAGARDVGT